MVYVPSGTFWMGNNEPDSNAAPAHIVKLDGYWIDKTEVTNAQFAKFINLFGNQLNDVILLSQPNGSRWIDPGNKYDGRVLPMDENNGVLTPWPGYEDHPVFRVSWSGAKAYCQWVGADLPTEAQWEYAARGPASYWYPWGNNYPDINANLGNWENIVNSKTTPVGSFPDGRSWVGAVDMAGNVMEWVDGRFVRYSSSPEINPSARLHGDIGVVRGGDAVWYRDKIRSDVRTLVGRRETGKYFIGFRCASRIADFSSSIESNPH